MTWNKSLNRFFFNLLKVFIITNDIVNNKVAFTIFIFNIKLYLRNYSYEIYIQIIINILMILMNLVHLSLFLLQTTFNDPLVDVVRITSFVTHLILLIEYY